MREKVVPMVAKDILELRNNFSAKLGAWVLDDKNGKIDTCIIGV